MVVVGDEDPSRGPNMQPRVGFRSAEIVGAVPDRGRNAACVSAVFYRTGAGAMQGLNGSFRNRATHPGLCLAITAMGSRTRRWRLERPWLDARACGHIG